MTTPLPRRTRALPEFFAGVQLLAGGFRHWVTAPRLMWLGLVPAVIVAVGFVAALVALAFGAEFLVTAATPFANDWDPLWRDAFRFAVVLAGFVVIVQLFVVLFTTVTLLVGDAFYEKIWLEVEKELGGITPAPERGWWAKLRLAIADALRLAIPAALIAIGVFVLGLIPVVGQVAAPVVGAFVGGWFLALELTGRPFEARGYSQQQRRKLLGTRRALTNGFGLATWLLFLVPFGAIIVMPAAVAGATLLSRRVLDELGESAPATDTIAHG